MIFSKIKTKHKYFLKIFCFLFIFLFFIGEIQASAHEAQFMAITYDHGRYGYDFTLYDDNGKATDTHSEADAHDWISWIKEDSKSNPGWSSNIGKLEYSTDETEMSTSSASDLFKEVNGGAVMPWGKTGNNKKLYYTFPPLHKYSASDGKNGTSEDSDIAYRIIDTVGSDFNNCLNEIYNTSETKPGIDASIIFSVKLANAAWKASMMGENNTVSYYSGGKTLKINVAPVSKKDSETKLFKDSKQSDLEYWNYVKISYNDETYYYIGIIDKGYATPFGNKSYTNEYLKKKIGDYKPQTSRSTTYQDAASESDFEWFGWKSIVYQGGCNYFVDDIDYAQVDEMHDVGFFESQLVEVGSSIYTGIINLLGLDTMEGLMLSQGRYGARTYLGLFPNKWLPTLNLMNIIMQLVAWSLLAFSMTKLLFKKSLSTMNVGEKIALMDGIKDLIVTAVVLGLFPIIFYMLSRFNFLLVRLFASMSPESSTFSVSMGFSSLAGFFIAFVLLIATIYFNFIYMLRSITLAALYIVAPLCIYTVSLGGKYRNIFSGFIKELISHIYIQSIHALLIALFSNLMSADGGYIINGALMKIVIAYSFIPITKYLQQNLFGFSDGTMSATASNAQQAARSYLFDREKGKGKGSGGSGGGSNVNTGSSEYQAQQTATANNAKNKMLAKGEADIKGTDSNLMLSNTKGKVTGKAQSKLNDIGNNKFAQKLGIDKATDGINKKLDEFEDSKVGMKMGDVKQNLSNTRSRLSNNHDFQKNLGRVKSMALAGAAIGLSATGDRVGSQWLAEKSHQTMSGARDQGRLAKIERDSNRGIKGEDGTYFDDFNSHNKLDKDGKTLNDKKTGEPILEYDSNAGSGMLRSEDAESGNVNYVPNEARVGFGVRSVNDVDCVEMGYKEGQEGLKENAQFNAAKDISDVLQSTQGNKMKNANPELQKAGDNLRKQGLDWDTGSNSIVNTRSSDLGKNLDKTGDFIAVKNATGIKSLQTYETNSGKTASATETSEIKNHSGGSNEDNIYNMSAKDASNVANLNNAQKDTSKKQSEEDAHRRQVEEDTKIQFMTEQMLQDEYDTHEQNANYKPTPPDKM